MIDFFNLADYSQQSQVFYTNGTAWQTWHKPRYCKMVTILCVGGGGGGGAGQNNPAGTTRQGGGGGGSAAYSMGMFAAAQIPDQLYLQVGPGGSGGAGGSTSASGSAGTLSYVSIESNTTAINILLQSGSTVAGLGVRGPSGGGGGAAGTAWTGGVLSDLGLVTAYPGEAGGLGSTNFVPDEIFSGKLTCGGNGGAGTNLSVTFTGGAVAGSGYLQTLPGGTLGGGNGSGGYSALNVSLNGSSNMPLIFTGGSGGGSSNGGQGGQGGAGAFGSGGGGGGAGVTSSAGSGGRGGDGLIIISCY